MFGLVGVANPPPPGSVELDVLLIQEADPPPSPPPEPVNVRSYAPAATQGPSLVSVGSSDVLGHVGVGDSGPGPPALAFFTTLRLVNFPCSFGTEMSFLRSADVLHTLSPAGS